jgi:hypothetical protein
MIYSYMLRRNSRFSPCSVEFTSMGFMLCLYIEYW